MSARARWALISGEDGAATSERVARIARALGGEGRSIGGFVQRRSVAPSGERRYEAVRLRDGAAVTLAFDAPAARGPQEEYFCSMAFQLEAFEQVGRWLDEDAPAELLVFDGLGKLEVQGRGHGPSLARHLARPEALLLLGARASQVGFLIEAFGLDEAALVGALEAKEEEAAFLATLRAAR